MENSIENILTLEQLLEDYLNRLRKNELNTRQKILLMEFLIKNNISNTVYKATEFNMLKYAFLGFYMYKFMIPEPDT